jgi:predicted nucleotide-binding protein (sugar kinase/HSP70/actin superfamily)
MDNFVGFENLDKVSYKTKRGEETRCTFCQNFCIRTFVEIEGEGQLKRFIIATCEKGQIEDRNSLRKLLKKRREFEKLYPNFVEVANRLAFSGDLEIEPVRTRFFNPLRLIKRRKKPQDTVVGIPRVLNVYSLAPFFRAFFLSLGFKRVIFSDYTSEEFYRKGAKRGSIDPCFPSKVALAHVHNLLYEKECDLIFFPCVRTLPPKIENAEGHWACPTVAATPEVVKAAFTKERDEFSLKGNTYLNPVLDFDNEKLLKRELFESVGKPFGLSYGEISAAVDIGFKNLRRFYEKLQSHAVEVLERLEREKRVGILLLSRPYHRDPGLNHGIPHELHLRGYPIFVIESLPTDKDYLEEKLGWKNPLDITFVWKKAYSENSSLKVWGALFASKHPNLAVVDLSSFKCGHDAPIYSTVEEILENSDTPYFTFHELDENRPAGAIKIRVETIDYFLKRYEKEKLSRA